MQTNQDQIGAFCSGFCSVIVNLILAYFMFTYAFANPDSGKCYATVDGTVASTNDETKALPGEFVNVT